MKMSFLFMGIAFFYSLTLSAVTYYAIDTTRPLHCYLSSKFQNRIMIEEGMIKKVIATECERLSIQIEEMTGQAFIYSRDPNAKETSVSVVSDTGVIQDIHICFIDRMPEVIVLQDAESMECQVCDFPDEEQIENTHVLDKIEEILSGNIPVGYMPSSMVAAKWVPKKGIELVLKSTLEGPTDIIYLYELRNTLKQPQTLLECELECKGCQWVYLETNTMAPKQKILSIVTVKKYE